MKSFNYIITDEIGIHARPAGLLAREAKAVTSKVTLSCNGNSAEATRLIAVMSMGVKKGNEVMVTVEGEDEETAIMKLQDFFKSNL